MTILQRQILKVVDNWSIISTAVASLKLEQDVLGGITISHLYKLHQIQLQILIGGLSKSANCIPEKS